MRYSLKTLIIGFEVPSYQFDQDNLIGIDELSNTISKIYENYFDILTGNSLSIIELPTLNYLILFNLIVRVDNDVISESELDKQWDILRTNVSEEILSFLKLNKVTIYEQLN